APVGLFLEAHDFGHFGALLAGGFESAQLRQPTGAGTNDSDALSHVLSLDLICTDAADVQPDRACQYAQRCTRRHTRGDMNVESFAQPRDTALKKRQLEVMQLRHQPGVEPVQRERAPRAISKGW